LVHHGELRAGANLAGLRVHHDLQVPAGLDRLLGGAQKRALYSLDQDIPFDALLLLEVLEHGDKFCVHGFAEMSCREQKKWAVNPLQVSGSALLRAESRERIHLRQAMPLRSAGLFSEPPTSSTHSQATIPFTTLASFTP